MVNFVLTCWTSPSTLSLTLTGAPGQPKYWQPEFPISVWMTLDKGKMQQLIIVKEKIFLRVHIPRLRRDLLTPAPTGKPEASHSPHERGEQCSLRQLCSLHRHPEETGRSPRLC